MILTNITYKAVVYPAHLQGIVWVPRGNVGYVPIDSRKFEAWQALAYAGPRGKTLFRREYELHEQWLASQPSAVDRQTYTPHTSIIQRMVDDLSSDERGSIDEVNESLGDELGEESRMFPTAEEVMIAAMDLSNGNKPDTAVTENHNSLGDRISEVLPLE
ncbi:LOW QUALITY PROTEIN: hypothetical protein PHMEG_00021471 [Phytophthora megakarya]|uniref:Uncharacterized protein n=1 Tax=Phytophthora megakarya TaxID=4795 RepID=A0A225VL46_9STRA|nr:LOW QUALITY PROTEIN: hypothetical protein PHMEG_00021471 [Phytophthora megakarya]